MRAPAPEETQVLVEEEAAGPPLPPDELPPDTPMERELWPWLLVLLVLVLAGLAAAYFATRDSNKKKATPQTTTVQTVTAQVTTPTAPATPPAAPVKIAVPALVGMKAPDALKTLREAKLQGEVKSVFSDKPKGIVGAQKPAAGKRVAKASTVELRVSKGAKDVVVPDVVGQNKDDAIKTVEALGLKPDPVGVPSTEPRDNVVAQHPKGGEKVPGEAPVRLNVSTGEKPKPKPSPSGSTTVPAPAPAPSTTPKTTTSAAPATVTVPDLTGKKLLAARKLIRKAGLVTEFKRVPNQLPKGTVVSQSPKPGKTAKRGDHVLVNVSLGPKPAPSTNASQVPVPDVTGQDQGTATQDLQSAGFSVAVVTQDTADPAEDGVVISQSPAPGQSAAAKSKVTIYVGHYNGG